MPNSADDPPNPPFDAADALDAIPDAVVVLDGEWRVAYVNAEAGRRVGEAPARFVGRPVREAFPELVGGSFERGVRVVARGRQARHLPYVDPRTGRRYDVRALPYRDGVLLSFRDVGAPNDSPNDSPNEAAGGAPGAGRTGVSVIQDGRFTWADARYAEIFGYTVGELLALDSPLAVVHPDDHALVREQVRRRTSGEGTQVQYTVRGVRRGGAPVSIDVHGVASTYEGRPAMIATVHEVTDDVAEVTALRDSNATLRAVIDTVPQAIVGVDLDRRVTRWNAAAERLFGWTAAEVVGRPLPTLPEGEGAAFDERMLELTETGETFEARRHRRDGSPVDVFISRAPLRDGEGRTTGFVAVITDISERKQLEEQLRQALKMEAIGRLAGGVAHDFNNLLTVILSNAELAQADGGAVAEELSEIRRAAERARALTSQLLTVSRRQVIRAEPLELNAVVRDAERMLRRVIPESVMLVADLSPDAGWVRADRGQLEQVLMNLAVNARDAIPTTGGTIFVRTARHAGAGGSRAVLTVRDTGSGMDAATQARLFEPFFTTKRAGEGTGLGLATVYGIVRQSGGDVRVESEPGAGTTISVRLPSADAPDASAPAPAAAPATTAAPGRTLMLVEDEGAVRTVARRILERAGYRVLEATNGAEGLQLWARHGGEVHAVVTDVVMPGMGGPALVERLLAARPTLPVVFMSGYADGALDGVDTRGRRVYFLAKPFSPDGLLRQVGEALDGL